MVEYCKNTTECQRELLMNYFGFYLVSSQKRCCCICDKSREQKQNECDPKRTLRIVDKENYVTLSSELFSYAKEADSKTMSDCYSLFAESSNILSPLIDNILNNYIIFNFVDTPRNFIIAKLSIRKPGSSSVLIKLYYINKILLALMKIRVYGSKALR